jgi:adhesin transport system outer membrane protein
LFGKLALSHKKVHKYDDKQFLSVRQRINLMFKQKNNKFSTMVCAAALMIFAGTVPSYAASNEARAMEERMRAEAEAAAAQNVPMTSPSLTAPSPATEMDVMAEPATSPATVPTEIRTIDTPTPPASADELPLPGTSSSSERPRVERAEEEVVRPEPPRPVLQSTNPENLLNSRSAPGYVPGASERITTLRDAVAVGVLTNPQYEAVANNRRATDEELNQAQALYLPSIDMRADTGFEHTSNDPDRGRDVNEDLYRSQASLTLTQMLFDGFETKYENERQKHRVRSASHRVKETSEFLGLDVVESYIDVLRQRELLRIAVENTKQHEEILNQIMDGANAGRSTQADVEQTNARLASARATEANVRQALIGAENSYRRRLGEVPQPDLTRPVPPREQLQMTVDEEVKQAQTQSPTLDIFEADVNVAEAEYRGSSSTMYPQIDLQLGATTAHDTGGVEGTRDGASALVVANWNLYRGGGDVARQREFVYRYAQTKSQRNDASRTLENDVRQTWASREAAERRAQQFQAQAEANAKVVQAYKDQFNLDRRTLLDVLDAQNEWFVSRSNAINNDYLEMFAVYRLMALKGALLPVLDVSYPKEVNPADKS